MAIASAALEGLPISPGERDVLLTTYLATIRLVAGVPAARQLLASKLREAAEVVVLERRIRDVLDVTRVDRHALPIFMRTLEDTFERLATFADRAPSSGCDLARKLLLGLGGISDRILEGHRELADYARKVTDLALAAARVDGAPTRTMHPLVVDLLDLWRADTRAVFAFAPKTIASLQLSRREKAWFGKEIDRRRKEPLSERQAAELDALAAAQR